jgi:phenylacetate-CoA ligase
MGSVNKIIKKSPNFIKSLYYKFVPFRYRYGNVYGKTLDFLLESQYWDDDKLKEYQKEELRKLLTHCYNNVSYYRDIFISKGWHPLDFKSIEDLKQFPVLTKEKIMRNPSMLIADNLRSKKGYPITTSGSTGDKLKFYVDDDCLKKEAAFNMRAYIQQGAKMYDTPSVWLRRYVPKDSNSSLWYYDSELKRLYMSAYHLNDKTIGEYVKKINEGNYQTMCTYPSAAYIFACLCEENNLKLKTIEKIHTTSEVLLNQWYDKIEDVFNITPCGHYGQMEKVSFMNQIESSRDMKQNLEYGVDEFYDNEDGTYGLISTGFINYYMPFIRYRTEDTFVIKDGVVKEVNGRSSDILISKDGSRLPGVNFYSWIDKKMPAIKMFQIIQKTDRDITFNYVQNESFTNDIENDIIEGLRSRLGDMNFTINMVDEIQRDPKSQKIRSIINQV